MSKLDIFLGRVNDASTTAAAANNIHEAATKNGDSQLYIVNQRGQLVASLTSLASVVTPRIAPVAIINMQFNKAAGSLTVSKILADSRTQSINTNDVLSVVGNISGVILSFAVLGARFTPAGNLALTALAVMPTIKSIYDAHKDTISSFFSELVDDMIKTGNETGYPIYEGRVIPSEHTVYADHRDRVAVFGYSPEHNTLVRSETVRKSNQTFPVDAGITGGYGTPGSGTTAWYGGNIRPGAPTFWGSGADVIYQSPPDRPTGTVEVIIGGPDNGEWFPGRAEYDRLWNTWERNHGLHDDYESACDSYY